MYKTKKEPEGKYGPWVVMSCQWRFISCNKGIALVRGVYNGGDSAWGGAGMYGELSVLSATFCCKPKNFLKKLSLCYKQEIITIKRLNGLLRLHRKW